MAQCFYNNLCSICYLEIRCWKGSMLCSAMYESLHGTFTGIDNFTEFNNAFAKEELICNISNFPNGNVCIIENDCFCVNTKTLSPKFKIFMYDGNHTYKAN